MTRVRLLVAIVLSLVCSIPALAEKRCKPSDREMFLPAEQVFAGSSFLASVQLEKHEFVSWEVSGGTIANYDLGSVTIVAGAPGTLEITATIDKGGHCDFISRSVTVVPVPCLIEDRVVGVNFNPAKTGQQVIAATSVFEADGETVQWEVIGGTITKIDEYGFVYIRVGGVGTMVVNAHITKGECSQTFSRSVPVECFIDDRPLNAVDTVGAGRMFFAAIGVWTDAAETVEWAVRGGTIVETGQPTGIISILAGEPGTLEIDATISRGAGCSKTFTRSVQVICMEDPTIGLFFDKGGVRVGETVKAWTNLSEGATAHWEIVNGTPASADGPTVDIVAGGTEGHMIIDLYVTKAGCTTHRRSFIFIQR